LLTGNLSSFALAALAALGLGVPLATAAPSAQISTLSGDGSAVGPDIILVNQQRVILLGIDAPEANQPCQDGDQLWKCGDTAFAVLDQLVKAGTVQCTLYGAPDRLGRYGGVCTVNGKDIAEQMVGQGLALAYPADKQGANYLPAQTQAQAAHVGLWKRGVVSEQPWEFRRGHNHTMMK
jgi:endonuclease YncB( thermonuclease family)